MAINVKFKSNIITQGKSRNFANKILSFDRINIVP